MFLLYYFGVSLNCNAPVLEALFIQEIHNNTDKHIKDAVRLDNNRYIIEYCLKENIKFDYRGALHMAAEYNRTELIEILSRNHVMGANFYIARGSARGGHRELFDHCVSQGQDNWCHFMVDAANGGHLELLKHILTLFPDYEEPPVDVALYGARLGNHKDVIEFLTPMVK
jgi:hypothetical protein